MRRIIYVSFFLVMSSSLIFSAGLPLNGAVQAKTLKLKLATVTPPHHAYNEGARQFARLIKERTGGAVDIRVYPGGQLGKGERELLEGMQMRTIDLAVTATGPVSGFSQSMMVLDLPFLFQDYHHVDVVLDGPIGRKLLNDLEKTKLKGLSFFENGFRNFTNSARPLLKPGDFKGLKFRTMENPVHLASVRQLGAQAVPMSWGEVYTSLQTKVIDGQENPVAIIHTFKLNEVQQYLSLTGHFYSPAPLTIGLKRFKSLKSEWQELFIKTAVEVAAYERKIIRDNEQRQIRDLKAWGMDVRNVDKTIFVKAMEPVYSKFIKQYPDWELIIERIGETK
ncbi:MAG: DctP family TRAP transporter solute-binding subunit [Deltaproteobacteria bacterium]|nr:MAG: DctP family TRAP transporter solute-binding subunit [Deltaproteobacteria bacterium]